MNLVGSYKSFKSLMIRFESSTAALTILTTFGVPDGATVFKFHLNIYLSFSTRPWLLDLYSRSS